MQCVDYEVLVAAHADQALAADERAAAEDHVARCERCARILAGQRRLVRALRNRVATQETPLHLRSRILAGLEAEERGSGWLQAATEAMRGWSARPVYRAALAGVAATVLVVVGLTLREPTTPGSMPQLLQEVAANYRAVKAHSVGLDVRTASPDVMRQHYRSAGVPFDDTVMDLSSKGYQLTGGASVRLGSAQATLTVYEDEQGPLLCQRVLAPETTLPAGGDPINGHVFFNVDGVSILAHKEGDVLCLMASDLPKEKFGVRLLGAT
jgi:anti-sigma factor RsiW